jgi:hypothetical protein
VEFTLGDGKKLKFWKEPWLHGQSIAEIAPDLFQFSTMRNMTVAQAMSDGKWMRHFKRNMSAEAIAEFLIVQATKSKRPGHYHLAGNHRRQVLSFLRIRHAVRQRLRLP